MFKYAFFLLPRQLHDLSLDRRFKAACMNIFYLVAAVRKNYPEFYKYIALRIYRHMLQMDRINIETSCNLSRLFIVTGGLKVKFERYVKDERCITAIVIAIAKSLEAFRKYWLFEKT